MTDTFTLTGTVADLGLEVRAGDRLRLTAEPAEWVSEDGVYHTAPSITTDAQGRICRDVRSAQAVDPVPADEPDVALVLGPRYTVTHRIHTVQPRVFYGTAGGVVEFSEIPLDPPDLPATPTWHAEIDRLDQRIDDLPTTGGGGPAYDDTQVRADFATADAATLTAANTHTDDGDATLAAQLAALTARVTALETATANALTLEV